MTSLAGSKPIIEVCALSKLYRLGAIGAPTLRETAERWGNRLRGRNGSAPSAKPVQAVSPARVGPQRNTFWALKDISFDVDRGEVVGIIGRNGAGKSTLLKVLSRITEPTDGKAILRGRVASLLEVGTGFHPELTGRENIFLNGAILGMKRAEIARKFDEIVAFAEVGAFIDTPVKRYSSGMYVRLAFAVAAHLEPEILIVDEVLAVGDIDFQRKCMGKMGSVAKEGRTVLLVTHNIGLIETLCSKAVLLRDGTVASQGAPAAVVADYLAGSDAPDSADLLSLPRHAGSGKARLASLRTFDRAGQPGGGLKMGDGLTIQLGIQAKERIAQPWIGITLRTPLHQQIFHFANREAGCELPPMEGDCTVECTIPALNLLPGRYVLDLIVADMSNTLHDQLSGAGFFDVAVSDVLGSGMPMEKEYGVVFFPSQWRLRNGNGAHP
jgi:lipopolysaccharide transport system ATP-binding protein